jgi:hypothetical protein
MLSGQHITKAKNYRLPPLTLNPRCNELPYETDFVEFP